MDIPVEVKKHLPSSVAFYIECLPSREETCEKAVNAAEACDSFEEMAKIMKGSLLAVATSDECASAHTLADNLSRFKVAFVTVYALAELQIYLHAFHHRHSNDDETQALLFLRAYEELHGSLERTLRLLQELEEITQIERILKDIIRG